MGNRIGEEEKTRVKTREKIIELVKEDKNITIQQLAQILGLSIKGIKWQMKKLKDEKIIKGVGSAKGGYWEIVENVDS